MDYTIWDLRNEFTIAEAAFLWFDVNPKTPKAELQRLPDAVKVKIKEMFSLLTEAGERKQIAGITWDNPFHAALGANMDIHTLSRGGLRGYAKRLDQRPLFLFPEAREPQGMNGQPKEEEISHSPDFRTVTKRGIPYTLTSKQAEVYKMLWDAREGGTPDLGQGYIIERVSGETATRRIKDFFKKTHEGREAWDQLIGPGKRKGTFRLKT